MVGAFGEKASLGQANGPEVELVVYGTELYARYETLDGYSVVYDETLGLFCYARVVAGSFQSTEVPVTSPPPPGLERHAVESDNVRMEKIKERTLQLEQRSRASPKRE